MDQNELNHIANEPPTYVYTVVVTEDAGDGITHNYPQFTCHEEPSQAALDRLRSNWINRRTVEYIEDGEDYDLSKFTVGVFTIKSLLMDVHLANYQ